ncbi:MAG: dienelactone hydrolase family protein, partial [Gemmatimonadales bacterium]
EQFSYDETDLNARVEYREESPGGWIHETISFDAAYGGERVLAHLFLPGNTPPPFQTVIYFPGGASRWTTSSEDLESYYEFSMFLSFLVRNGRAVLYPVYKGTFERGSPALMTLARGAESHAYTEYLIQTVKDFKRSVDYLETRPDIDSERLAFYGMSWGGWIGAIIPAVEERLGASILVAGGFGGRARPEAHELNYVTRVETPTLMLNGRYDNIFALEEKVRPMFDLLGTPAEHKRLILYDTDHIPPRAEFIKETLAWLDEYLGPVGR